MNFPFRFYFSLFLKRLPVMTGLFLICAALGLVTAIKAPPSFSTAARFLVEPPQIPDSMVASLVQTEAAEQLQVIEQRLLTRANLIDIAQKYRVFPDISTMSPDAVVQGMREATRISRSSGRGQATLMTVRFSAQSGQIAANVVNEYMTLILETSSVFRLSRAENTLSFFEQEAQRLSTDLDRTSARIVSFKNTNVDALPDDLEYRLGRQALLQERLGRLERERNGARSQREEAQRLFEVTGQVRQEQTNPQVQLSPQEAQLAALRFELEQSQAVLSDTNPKVILLQNRVKLLEDQVAAQVIPPDQALPDSPEQEPIDPVRTMLDVTLADIDTRITAASEEIEEVNTQLVDLEDSISRTAANAIALNALEREYDNTQTQYNEALNNLNGARMSERLEVTSQAQRITVIEGPSVPQEPSAPNRLLLAAMGIAMGGGLAGGYFVLLELLNRTIRRPEELKKRFDIIPLITIPYMETRAEKFKRRGFLVSMFVMVLVTVPAGLWYVHNYYIPLELLAIKVANRLGGLL